MKKSDRVLVHAKYGGKCAYCGCDIELKGMHVDHLLPLVRNWKYDRATGKDIALPPTYPERDCMDNWMPACASCNINKHSMDLEGFRQSIAGYLNSLNLYHNQYKFAKRYGLVVETGSPVIFYFETQTA